MWECQIFPRSQKQLPAKKIISKSGDLLALWFSFIAFNFYLTVVMSDKHID